jgi:hypothetical protein
VAFVAGGVVARLAQGVVFGLLLGAAMAANGEEGQQIIASTLLLIVGLLLLITAFRKWRKEEDPDEPPPKWNEQHRQPHRVCGAFGAGALYVAIAVKQWVVTLSAISIISAATLERPLGIGVYLFYVLLTQTLVLPAHLVLRSRARASSQAAAGRAGLAGSAQSGDCDRCVFCLWLMVFLQRYHRTDRLSRWITPLLVTARNQLRG